MTTAEFAAWFNQNAASLRTVDAQQAVDTIHEQLVQVDPDLSVQIGDADEGRELIVSASGNVELFPLVDELCAQLQGDGWRIQALQPGSGFDFTLSTEELEVPASEVYFEVLQSPQMPDAIGIRLLAPPELVEAVGQVAWMLVEIGAGERAASWIDHLEAGPLEPGTKPLSIRELPAFLDYRLKKKAKA